MALTEAASRLVRNNDFKKFLTDEKEQCIEDFKAIDATPEQLAEANRRYNLADKLEHRIEQYAARRKP